MATFPTSSHTWPLSSRIRERILKNPWLQKKKQGWNQFFWTFSNKRRCSKISHSASSWWTENGTTSDHIIFYSSPPIMLFEKIIDPNKKTPKLHHRPRLALGWMFISIETLSVGYDGHIKMESFILKYCSALFEWSLAANDKQSPCWGGWCISIIITLI